METRTHYKKKGRNRKAKRVGRKLYLNKMKTDFYTKAVLTVIAACLTIIVLKQVDIIPKAYAGTPKTNLNNNMNYGLVPLNTDGSIDVNIKSSSEIYVNITGVNGGYVQYGKLPVVIKENQDKD